MFNFMPKEEKFFELFDAQAAHNVEGAKVFMELVKKWSLESPLFQKLQDIEHEADISAHEIYDKLNRSFITPFDREDIRELGGELDDIIDLLQSVASRMQLYHIETVHEDLINLAGILLQATENVRKAVAEMKVPEKQRRVLDYCIEINRLENAGDRSLEHSMSRLFQGKPDPLEVIKWKEIYEGLEEAIDKCEDVANTIETILIKNA